MRELESSHSKTRSGPWPHDLNDSNKAPDLGVNPKEILERVVIYLLLLTSLVHDSGKSQSLW